MVEAIKEEATKNWPLLLLVLVMTGGGTSLGNLVLAAATRIRVVQSTT